MPEGPEVALTAQILDYKVKGKKINNIEILSGKYKRDKPNGFNKIKKVLPLKILSVNSKGKFIWFELEDGYYMLNNLGMTGIWGFEKNDSSRLSFDIGKKTMYFSDQRNFGNVNFTNDKKDLDKKLKELAPDFLKTDYEGKDIYDRIQKYMTTPKRKNLTIVEALMEQKAIGSGIGNYLVAEILYKAKISPYRKLSDITKKDAKKLSKSIKYLMKLSYETNVSGYMELLKKYLKKMRRKKIFEVYHKDIKLKEDEFEYKVYQQDNDPLGNKVLRNEIIKSRTTHWVKQIQI